MTAEGNENTQSQTSELRKFGVIMTIFLALLGGLFLWRGRSYYWCFFVLSLLFAGFGLVRPTVLGPVHKAWMKLSRIIGWFMSRLILIILFYLVMTPTALLLRMFGKAMLNINFKKNWSESYWIPREAGDHRERDYERQF
ncbi:MAG: hypothetical protein KAV87_33700 [Desulfobacteraceae bacterium]|nr:hypothetical protein [Desulfobacteraceae bacterium]